MCWKDVFTHYLFVLCVFDTVFVLLNVCVFTISLVILNRDFIVFSGRPWSPVLYSFAILMQLFGIPDVNSRCHSFRMSWIADRGSTKVIRALSTCRQLDSWLCHIMSPLCRYAAMHSKPLLMSSQSSHCACWRQQHQRSISRKPADGLGWSYFLRTKRVFRGCGKVR